MPTAYLILGPVHGVTVKLSYSIGYRKWSDERDVEMGAETE